MQTNNNIRPGNSNLTKKTLTTKTNANSIAAGSQNQLNVSEGDLQEFAIFSSGKSKINKQIEKLLPELKQAKLIITSSIISANDFSKVELNSDYEDILGLPNSTKSEIKTLIDNVLTRYKIAKKLSKTVDRIAFDAGADVEIIIPRHKITKIITGEIKSNKDLEEFIYNKENKGLEGKGFITNMTSKVTVNLDEKTTEDFELEDIKTKYIGDISFLALPETINKQRKIIAQKDCYLDSKSKSDLESLDTNILNSYLSFKNLKKERLINLSSKDSSHADDLLPFTLNVNPDTVIPLYIDDPSDQVGVFILVDDQGNKINGITDEEFFMSSADNTVTKTLLNKASVNLNKAGEKAPTLEKMKEITAEILYKTIADSTEKSVYKANFNVDKENALVQILLYRALADKQTRIVFVPAEYVSYIAFDYRENGTGKSLLEDISVLASFKAMLTLAEIYSNINKAVPTTEVVVNIDEKDPEPMKTKETIKQLVLDARRGSIPWGETSLEKQGQWIQNAGIRFTYNHPAFPATSITFEKGNNKDGYELDSTVKENIDKDILKSLGLSPSIIDDANGPDFASVAVLNNSLANNINSERQNKLDDGMSDRVRKIMRCDGAVIKTLSDIVDANQKQIIENINEMITDETQKITTLDNAIKQYIINDIIDGVRVKVPRAESKDKDDQREKFNNYSTSVSELLDVLKSTILLSDVSGLKDVDLDAVFGTFKLDLVMKWCEEHNYARDVVKFLNDSDDISLKDRLEELGDSNQNLVTLIVELAKKKKEIMNKYSDSEETPPVEPTVPLEEEEEVIPEDTIKSDELEDEIIDEETLPPEEKEKPVEEVENKDEKEVAPTEDKLEETPKKEEVIEE